MFTLSVQSLVIKPCENMQRAEDSIRISHWEIISQHMNMSIFNCRFIIILPFTKWLWRPVPLLFKITKCHFVALNLPFYEREEASSLMIAFTNWPHTISFTHATCWNQDGIWRRSCKLLIPTCLVDRRKWTRCESLEHLKGSMKKKSDFLLISRVSMAYYKV